MRPESSEPCPECQVGELQPKRSFYFEHKDGRPICVPSFPVWVCDICKQRLYDATALAALHAMLESDRQARRRPQRRRRTSDRDGTGKSIQHRRRP
ncbi:MAG: YgiT-type zinc finger protein [Anaerolineales bacterium]|nr:YgiT-type zinc finger protein [Anaerolineales bacterium]